MRKRSRRRRSRWKRSRPRRSRRMEKGSCGCREIERDAGMFVSPGACV
jgi:hypothetical protein